MEEQTKKFEHDGVFYEIRLIRRMDGTFFLKDFRDGSPFTPFLYSIDKNVNVNHVENIIGTSLMKYMIAQVEEGIIFWLKYKNQLKFN